MRAFKGLNRVITVVLLFLVMVIGLSSLPALAAQQKTGTNLLSAEEIAQIRESRTWPGKDAQKTLALADKWMKYSSEQLRELVPPAWVPRALDVNFEQDPLHSEAIKKLGRYPWIISPDLPYKVKCPVGGEIYPTNDFDPTHPTSPEDVSEEAYVDNGWGWRKPGEDQKYWFVGYYVHWLWRDHLQPATVALSEAYVITGEQKYARQAAVLLDRIAEVYPDMDYDTQSRMGTEIQINNYPGRVVNNIWEASLVSGLATAYDYIFPAIADDEELVKATGKSSSELRKHIETNLLENAAESIYKMDGRIRGNFGMHHRTLATLAIVLDNEKTNRYLDMVLHATGGGMWLYEGIISGLNNFIFRDGAPNESSPAYNSGWLPQFDAVAKLLMRRGINLYEQVPKLRKMFDYPLRLAMGDKYTPNIGDQGGVTSAGIVGWNSGLFNSAYQQYGDDRYLMGRLPEYGSDNMSAYGLAMLRTDKGSKQTGLSVYYGPGGGHDHYARLNLELFAKGQRLLPDLGYPEYASFYHQKRYAWTSNTVSHNTVVVNEARQTTKDGGRIQLFAASPSVQYVDVRAEEAYPGVVDRYERSLALVDAPGHEAYAVDVFRVHGGRQHDYSIHGPSGSFSVAGVTLSAPTKGSTVAGGDVAYGELYDAPNLAAKTYKGVYYGYQGSGFSYLKEPQWGKAEGVWSADWKLEASEVGLRTTFLPQPGTEVIVADGIPPRNVPGNPDSLKYILARTEAKAGEALGSTFVTIIQPYEEQPYIKSVKAVGEVPQGAEAPVALAIEHDQGTDYVFQSVNAALQENEGERTAFQGSLGVVSRTPGDMIQHASLIGGTLLRQGDLEIRTPGSYEGHVTSVEYAQGRVVVELDEGKPALPAGQILAGERIVISNRLHATEYVIKKVEPLGSRAYALDLEEPDFLTGKGVVGAVTEQSSGKSTISTPTPMVLGHYYNGQWMVDPISGRSRQIQAFEKNGDSIELDGDAMGLQTGDLFSIYDFGAGDSFRIASAVYLEASKDGEYQIKSNVTGSVTLWDDAQHDFEPGVQTVTVPVLDLEVTKPHSDENVQGTFEPEIHVRENGTLKVAQVVVQMDGKVIYSGKTPPNSGAVKCDTKPLQDGSHVFAVTAIDSLGKGITRLVPVTVKNWWEISTDLTEPINTAFFGVMDFTKLEEKSSGWDFVKGNDDDFLGDADRMVRTSTSDQFLVWKTPTLRSFEVTLYSKDSVLPDGVEFAVAADEEAWSEVSARAEVIGKSATGWHKLKVTGEIERDLNVRFFRVMLRSKVPAADLQIGEVKIRGELEQAI